MINIVDLSKKGIGKIVYRSEDYPDILQLPVSETMELFKSFGVLLFRGFDVTPVQMKFFSEKFSSRHFLDFTKKSIESEKFVNFVDNGTINRVAHCEHAYTPFRPDVIWFCCTVPAVQGGETLFWDGVRVWEELSQKSKQLFLDKKLKFYYEIPPDVWKKYADSDAIADFEQMLDSAEGVSYQINENQTVYLEYVCSAVVKTKYGNQDAFANSFWAVQKRSEKAVFEDDSRASDEIASEVENVLAGLEEEIPWQAGDLVMIDNSRFLHGRREFDDKRRQVFTTISNLKF